MLPVRLILKGWAKKTQFMFPLDVKYVLGTRHFSNKTAILLDSQNN